MEDDGLDFNFWPAFADMMLALVLVLVLVLFLVAGVITVGTVNLEPIEKNQANMVNTIASVYGTKPRNLDGGVIGISISNTDNYDIEIRNELNLQRITFSDKILFSPDDYRLNPTGREVLRVVGAAVKQQLSLVREIQIRGHADTDRTSRFPSNVHLASLRSIEVFEFLQDSTGINPAEHLMSATSFGEFSPVQRAEDDLQFDQDKLFKSNSTPELKSRNRRIELLLIYRR
jgi:flagellar motor protein MotB